MQNLENVNASAENVSTETNLNANNSEVIKNEIEVPKKKKTVIISSKGAKDEKIKKGTKIDSQKIKEAILKDRKKIDTVNISKSTSFEDRIKNRKVSEISNKNSKGSYLYVYPETVKTKADEKAFRTKRRNELEKINNLIVLSYQKKNNELLKTEINNFKKLYKEFYKMNDFSVSSLTQSNDADVKSLIEEMLYIVKKQTAKK